MSATMAVIVLLYLSSSTLIEAEAFREEVDAAFPKVPALSAWKEYILRRVATPFHIEHLHNGLHVKESSPKRTDGVDEIPPGFIGVRGRRDVSSTDEDAYKKVSTGQQSYSNPKRFMPYPVVNMHSDESYLPNGVFQNNYR